MYYRLELLSSQVLRAIHHMDTQEWLVLSVLALGLGVVFLRGFGSRTAY
jgi:hypothetical protein